MLHRAAILPKFPFPRKLWSGWPAALTVKNVSDSFAPLSTEKVVKAQEGRFALAVK